MKAAGKEARLYVRTVLGRCRSIPPTSSSIKCCISDRSLARKNLRWGERRDSNSWPRKEERYTCDLVRTHFGWRAAAALSFVYNWVPTRCGIVRSPDAQRRGEIGVLSRFSFQISSAPPSPLFSQFSIIDAPAAPSQYPTQRPRRIINWERPPPPSLYRFPNTPSFEYITDGGEG